jgi:hypothetical protein
MLVYFPEVRPFLSAYLKELKMHRRCRGLLSKSAQGTIDAVHASATVESQDGEIERVDLAIIYRFVAVHCRTGKPGHVS